MPLFAIADTSQYASGFGYRAWGGIKQVTDGTSRTSSYAYNKRLQPKHFEITTNFVSEDYDYYDDRRLKSVDNLTDGNFDRLYSYDHASRLTLADSGGNVNQQTSNIPYFETFGYDAFGNTTARLKATECLANDRAGLLTFYDFPAEHWQHIRTTNPIESTFSTVRLRTTKTRGCVSRAGMLAMVFKLTKTAEQKWRTLKGHTLLVQVVQGVKFKDGLQEEAHQVAA